MYTCECVNLWRRHRIYQYLEFQVVFPASVLCKCSMHSQPLSQLSSPYPLHLNTKICVSYALVRNSAIAKDNGILSLLGRTARKSPKLNSRPKATIQTISAESSGLLPTVIYILHYIEIYMYVCM